MAGFYAVTNPRWQNFKNLFRFIDAGDETPTTFPSTTAGCSRRTRSISSSSPDTPWTTFFHTISNYDFADEVNLDVLGKIVRAVDHGIGEAQEFGLVRRRRRKGEPVRLDAAIGPSGKQLGIYDTPPELTSRDPPAVHGRRVDRPALRGLGGRGVHGIPEEEAKAGQVTPDDADYWRRCLAVLRRPQDRSRSGLRQRRVSGSRPTTCWKLRYNEVIGHLEQDGETWDAKKPPRDVAAFILRENLYGVDLSPEAVEITQLALSDSLGFSRGSNCSKIFRSTSSTATRWFTTPKVHPAVSFDWRERFPEVFGQDEPGFDCVIGNPPGDGKEGRSESSSRCPPPISPPPRMRPNVRQLVARLQGRRARFVRTLSTEALAAPGGFPAHLLPKVAKNIP